MCICNIIIHCIIITIELQYASQSLVFQAYHRHIVYILQSSSCKTCFVSSHDSGFSLTHDIPVPPRPPPHHHEAPPLLSRA